MNKTLKTGSAAAAAGFTLIELMIVVAVVAILASIAYPGYRNHVTKTQRGAAKACLAQYASFMERYYTTNLTYVGASPGNLNCALEGSMANHYTFSVGSLTATGFVASAVPTASFLAREKGPICGTLTLNQMSTRTASGSSGVALCW